MHDGRHQDKYRPEKGNVLVLAKQFGDESVYVTHDDVRGYIENQEFQYILSVYQYTKLWGMPNGQGWANEPSEILDGITALEIEAKLIEAEAMNGRHNSGTGESTLLRRDKGV